MRKIVMALLIIIGITSCYEKERKLYVFIPEGYLGKIGLYFGIESAKNHMLSPKDDVYLLFLSGKNLAKYDVKEKNFPSGPYQIYYYYYSKDTLYQIKSPVSGYNIETPVEVGLMSASGNYGSIQSFRVIKSK